MASPSPGTDRLPRRTVVSALLGNFIEWYDLAIYAYAAAAIGATFFADAPTNIQLIASFSAFALSYLVRPVSGLVLGVLGDRIGRKRILVFTILIMGAATTAIGLLPGYAHWGVVAPLVLLLLRVLQGIGAAGEFMGAATFVVEHSPVRRRGFAIGLIQLGTGLSYPFAFLIAFALIQYGGTDWYNDGGWRIMFLISAPLTLVALYIRSSLEETPVFVEMKKAQAMATAPVRETLRHHGRVIVACFLFMMCFSSSGAVFLFYLPNRLSEASGPGGTGRVVAVLGLLLFALSIPVWGHLVDRISRHAVRLFLSAATMLLAVPCMVAVESGAVPLVAAGYAVQGLLCGLCFSIVYVTLVEQVPARVRFTGTALIDNLSKALVTGTTVLVSLSLIELTGSDIAPGWYVAAMSVPSVFAAFWLRRMDSERDDDGGRGAPGLHPGEPARSSTD
jgi:MHS family proline/betaine transporter-like MFS transporter